MLSNFGYINLMVCRLNEFGILNATSLFVQTVYLYKRQWVIRDNIESNTMKMPQALNAW